MGAAPANQHPQLLPRAFTCEDTAPPAPHSFLLLCISEVPLSPGSVPKTPDGTSPRKTLPGPDSPGAKREQRGE